MAKKGMPKAAMAGLMAYGKKKSTKDIARDLDGKDDIEDPNALAAWVRRRAKGMTKAQFAKYGAKMKREGK